MSSIVVVHGATSQQGGGVVRALSQAGIIVRAVVRDSSAPNAVEIASLPGVSLITPDLTDSVSIAAAYKGADAVFGWTRYMGEELIQGRAMVDAAKLSGVGLFVWSSLISISEHTQGRLTACAIYENKHHIVEYIKSHEIPSTILNLGGFDENFLNFPGQATYDREKDIITLRYGLINSEVPMPMLRARVDVGNAVLAIVQHPSAFTGRTIHLGDETLSTLDMARIVTGLSGRKAVAPNSPTNVDPSAARAQNEMSKQMYEFGNTVELLGMSGLVPDPLLKEHGFKASTFEGFVREELLPYLGLKV